MTANSELDLKWLSEFKLRVVGVEEPRLDGGTAAYTVSIYSNQIKELAHKIGQL